MVNARSGTAWSRNVWRGAISRIQYVPDAIHCCLFHLAIAV